MFDLDTEDPTFFWMFEGDSKWAEDRLTDVIVTDRKVKFDYPSPDWDHKYDFVEMNLNEDGYFVWQLPDGSTYRCVRAESSSHTILLGNWREDGSQGPCVIVLPKASA